MINKEISRLNEMDNKFDEQFDYFTKLASDWII